MSGRQVAFEAGRSVSRPPPLPLRRPLQCPPTLLLLVLLYSQFVD